MNTFNIRQSKYRNINCVIEPPTSHDDIQYCDTIRVDQSVLTATNQSLAFPSASNAGASIEIRPIQQAQGLATKVLLQGHSEPVTALTFSPFHERQSNVQTLLSGSADATIKVWHVDDSSNNSDSPGSRSCQASFSCPESISDIQPHPSAEHLVACITSNGLQILDVESQAFLFTTTTFAVPQRLTSCEWSYDGALLYVAHQSGQVSIVDPRNNNENPTCQLNGVHSGGRKNIHIRSGGLLHPEHFLTFGSNARLQEREVKLWDRRDTREALTRVRIDGNVSSSIMPMFDRDTNVVWIGGKGNALLQTYELDLSQTPFLHAIQRTTMSPTLDLTLLPKSACDAHACEIARVVNVTKQQKTELLRFQVPRKNRETFQSDLYPDTTSSSPAMSSADWWTRGLTMMPRLEPVTLDYFESRTTGTTTNTSQQGDLNSTSTSTTQQGGLNSSSTKGSPESPNTSKTEDTEEQAQSSSYGLSAKAIQLGTRQKNKFHYLKGTRASRSDIWTNFQSSSHVIVANTQYWAAPVQGSAGGPVYVHRLDAPSKVPSPPAPILNGHKLPVMSMAFHPFHEHVLVTGSEDTSCCVWDVRHPQEKPQTLPKGGHFRGSIRSLDFHPTMDNVLLSSSSDGSLCLWDVSTYICIRACPHVFPPDDSPVGPLTFNEVGNVVAASTSKTVVQLLDVRTCAVLATSSSSLETGPLFTGSRVHWCGDTPYICSVGINRRRQERELSIWDSRSLGQAVNTTRLGGGSSTNFSSCYDASTHVVYVASRGTTSIVPYELNFNHPTNAQIPTPQACDGFHSATSAPVSGITMLPKRMCNIRDIEVSKFLCLTQNTVEPVSFHLPRSDKLARYFQDDVYPAAESGKPCASISMDEWFTEGKDPLARERMSLRPPEMVPVSQRRPIVEEKAKPRVTIFRETLEREAAEKERQEREFTRLRALAEQRAAYHPNVSAKQEEVDSDDDWDD